MKQEVIQETKEENFLQIINPDIKICIVCGDDKIESFEFGMSCEECGTSFGRKKHRGGEMDG